MAIARTRLPEQYAKQYFREIRKLLKVYRRQIWQAYQSEIRPRIHRYRHLTPNAAGFRANDELEEIRKIIERLRETAEAQIFAAPVVDAIVRGFVKKTNRYTRANFRQQVVRVVGFDPTINEPWLASFMETAVQENVGYIKTIGSEYHAKISSIVLQGVRRGRSITDMGKEISEAGNVSIRRARFIARDQIGSIHGDLVKRRQKELGLRRFRWRTSRDERVRDEHEAFDGKVYDWNKGAGPRGLIPGEDYNCRCTADPLEEELLEVADSG